LWYRSGGKRGAPLEDQELIEFCFAIGRLPDELDECDETWVNTMIAVHQTKLRASNPKR
jgi:hypothetical protein